MNPVARAALQYARKGIPVFPCTHSKQPMVARGFHAATTEEDQIAAWFDIEPPPFIGVPTGERSGLWVLDIDRKGEVDGGEALDRIESEHGRLPDTVVALTPSGGEHRVFLWRQRVKCSSGALGPGLDVRGDGGYVIVPPSGDGNGRAYEFEASNPPQAVEAPAWLEELVRPRETREPREYVEPPDPDRRRALLALRAIQYGGNARDEWVELGMSYAAAGGDFDSWDAWCQEQPGYVAENVRREWDSFDPDGAITAGTLFHRAREYGWTDPGAEVYIGTPEAPAPPVPPTLNEFKALAFPRIDPILGPVASQQLNLIFAPTGAGKTMFGLAMAHAMAECREFIGWPCVRPVRVLYVDGEMAARMMQERLHEAHSDRLYIANLPGWWADQGGSPLNMTTEAAQELMSEWVEAIGADVIMLDNFMSLAWKDGTSFSSDEIWSPMRRWMIRQRAANRTVILVDHSNAQGGVFGTKTKTHIMDLILNLEPVSPDQELENDPDSMLIQAPWVRLNFTKNRGFRDSDDLVNQRHVRISPPGINWQWEKPPDSFLHEITAMRKDGLTIRDIATHLGVNYSKVQRAWKRVQTGDSQ